MYVIKAIIYSTLFIWLFREGTIMLKKYASKIFRLKVSLGAIDNIDHWKPWFKCCWRCLKHSKFLSIPLSCLFHLFSIFRFCFSNMICTTRATTFVNNRAEMLYLIFIIEKGLHLVGIPSNVKSDFAIG